MFAKKLMHMKLLIKYVEAAKAPSMVKELILSSATALITLESEMSATLNSILFSILILSVSTDYFVQIHHLSRYCISILHLTKVLCNLKNTTDMCFLTTVAVAQVACYTALGVDFVLHASQGNLSSFFCLAQTQHIAIKKRAPSVCVCVCCFVLLNRYWGIVMHGHGASS